MDTHFSAQSGPGKTRANCQYKSCLWLCGLLLLAAFGAGAQPQPLAVSTVAGAANFGSADGIAPAAKFLFTAGVAVDNAGNVYVADTLNDIIRKVSASGVVTTLAGTVQVAGTNNGVGSAALFNQPYGVAVDAGGNVYVADTGNGRIRKIATNGLVTTVAGVTGTNGYLDGPTNLAAFNHPYGLCVDAATNIYVADTTDNLIRKISGGVVSTIAGDNRTNDLGQGTNFGNVDGTNFSARFTTPLAIAVDKSTNLYVADFGNNTIRRISPAGTNWVVTTLAGNTNHFGSTNGVGTNATFYGPTGIAVDSLTNVYVADLTNQLIRLVAFTNGGWKVSTLAGMTNASGGGLFGNADGFSLNSTFNNPWGIAVDSAANVYIGDSGNSVIREIAPDVSLNLVVSTLAGPQGSAGLIDSSNLTAARFDNPYGVAVDAASNIYVADSFNNCIRQINPSGVNTIAGSPSGFAGTNDGVNAQFSFPTGLCVDANTNVYVADFDNSTIRLITPVYNSTNGFTNWVTSTIAGQPDNPGFANNAVATNALFWGPAGVAIDSASNIYVADNFNNVVRIITNAGAGGVSTFATGFNGLNGIAWNPANSNIYVADTGNAAVEELDSQGNFLTSLTNGIGYPLAVAVDPGGAFVYIADTYDNSIWATTSALKQLRNVAGTNGLIGSADGFGSASKFDQPSGLALDSSSNVYVADTLNNIIRVGVPVISGVNAVLTADTSPSGLPISINGINYGATPQPLSLALNSTVTAVVASNAVSITALATNTFVFANWVSNGVTATASTNYTFTLTTNTTIVAKYVPQYTVNLSASPGGGGTEGGGGVFASNTSVTAMATNNSGFVFTNWTQGGVVVSTNTNYNFTLTGDVSLVANYLTAFTLGTSVSPTGGGNVTAGGIFVSNSLVTVIATNNASFVFSNWTVNGVQVAATTNYSFNITSNETLVANFTPLFSFTTSAAPGAGGSVSHSGTNLMGASITVNATNSAGYVFNNWTSNGTIVTTTTNFTFALATNVTLVANFLPLFSDTVSVTPAGSGTASPSGTNALGAPITVVATNNANFVFTNWTSNGISVSTTTNFSFNIATNVTLVAHFLPLFADTVSVSPPGSGTASPSGTNVTGTVITVNATNAAGFVFTNWTSNGISVSTNTSYTFTLNTNATLVANFLPLFAYTVSASPGADGTVGASGTNVTGTSVTVVATNNPGFAFVNWTSNGVVTVSTTNYTFTLNTNVALVANFVPTYLVAASVLPTNSGTVGGTGFVAGNGTFPSNASVSIVANALPGYVFTNWTSNGVSVATTPHFTFTVITNVTLVANFLPLFGYTVSASPGADGTVSASGTNVIGTVITVNATNNAGFVFTNWTSNGISVATTTNFTFALSTNVNMVANFLPLFADTVSVSPAGSGTASPSGTNALGTSITVVATNNANYVFTNWTSNGISVATTTNFTFSIATNVNLVANFLPLFPYTAAASPNGSGTVSPGGTNVIGTVITVNATNAVGFVFTNWTSNGIFVSTNASYTFTLNTNAALVANFLPLFNYTVSASPGADGTVGASGTKVIGSVITVSATNNPGFAFINWTSNSVVVGVNTNYTFVLNTNVALVANFLPTYNLTVNASPASGGTFSAGGTYISNTLVTVVSTNNPGYAFTNWTSNSVSVSTSSNYSFNISTNLALTANFFLTPHSIAVYDGGTPLTNNQTNVISLGVIQVNQPDPTASFTISNLGGLPLTISNISVPSGFVLTNTAATLTNFPGAIPGLTNAPATNGVFTVALTTSNLGAYAGTVVITNDDTNFSFPISGIVTSPAPVIRVLDGTNSITNGQVAPDFFGSVPLNQAALVKIFTITNPGLLALGVSNVSVPAGYTLVASPPTNIPGTNSATFTVRLNTTTPGIFAGNIVITNTDTNNDPFVFPVSGQVTVKTIALGGNLTFGVLIAGTPATQTMVISNLGNTNLTVSNITYPLGFSGAFSGVIAPGSSQNVTVTFMPPSAAHFGGAVIVNSDATGGVNTISASGFGANNNLFLVVITNGAGTVAPVLTAKALVAGKKYTLTATAKTGNVFSNWTGSVTTNKSSLTFVMEPGTILSANFVTNPFLPVKGTYNGLFTATNGDVTEATAGMLKGLTIATKGTYSGSLLINGAPHGLSGTFNLAGQATNKITRPDSQGGNLLVLLNVVTSSNALPIVTGTIYGTNNGVPWVSTNLVADLQTNLTFSSDYTMTIPPSTNNPASNSIPGGDGYALITNHAGAVKISGALADGTVFSESVPVSQSGDVPVYASLYANKGLLLGWINLDATNAPGSLAWIHPTARTGFFTSPFSSTNFVKLSGWTNPPAGSSLPQHLVVLEMANGAVTQSNAFVITVSNNYKIGEISGPLPLSGTLNPKTGQLQLVIGSKADKQTANGAVLLNGTNGGGFFTTKTNTGAVILAP